MKKLFLAAAVLLTIAGSGQHYIQASIQQGSTANSADIVFLPNYTPAAGEYVNYLSLSIAIPTASAAGVTPTIGMKGPFAGITMTPAVPFTYVADSQTIYSWVFSTGSTTMTWASGVEFTGATITFNGGTGATNVSLVDFSNYSPSGGNNTNTFYLIVTNAFPFDVANYSSLFYSISSNGSSLGTYPNGDQYVQTSLPIFLSSFCPTPATPTVGGITTTGAGITWLAVSGVTSYEYEISTSSTPPSSGIVTSDLSYSATGLAVGTKYYFHIRSICSPGNYSGWTTVDFATICPATTSITISGITPSGAKIKWIPVPESSLGYQYIITNSPSNPSGTPLSVLDDNATVTGLNEGTTYYVHVRVNCNPGVFSEWFSEPFTTTYPPCLGPGSITVSNISNSADINWSAVSGGIGYEYSVTTSQTPPGSGISTGSTKYHVTGLESNTKYNVYLRTKCDPNQYSPWVKQTFFTPCFPATPFLIKNSTNPGTAEIGWQYIKGALGYEYAILSGANPPAGTMNFTSDSVLQVQNLVPGKKYYFHIRTQCAVAVVSPWRTLEFHISGINVISNSSSKTVKITIYGTEVQSEEIAIFDCIGRLLKRVKMNGNTANINLEGNASGIYFIKFGREGKYVAKVIL